MKSTRKKEKTCKQSIVLQEQIDRQKKVLKEASKTIFDNVSQDLATANIDLFLAARKVAEPEVAESKIQAGQEKISRAITDLRQLGNHIDAVIDREAEMHKKIYGDDPKPGNDQQA